MNTLNNNLYFDKFKFKRSTHTAEQWINFASLFKFWKMSSCNLSIGIIICTSSTSSKQVGTLKCLKTAFQPPIDGGTCRMNEWMNEWVIDWMNELIN